MPSNMLSDASSRKICVNFKIANLKIAFFVNNGLYTYKLTKTLFYILLWN